MRNVLSRYSCTHYSFYSPLITNDLVLKITVHHQAQARNYTGFHLISSMNYFLISLFVRFAGRAGLNRLDVPFEVDDLTGRSSSIRLLLSLLSGTISV